MACKCYFSVPLPQLNSLLVWAYVRFILSVAYAAMACYMAALLVHQNHSNLTLVPSTLWIGLAFVNLTFSNILVVGLYNKTYTMLLTFQIYSVVEVILTSAYLVWRVIKVMPLLSHDSNSFYNYWRQQLTSIECLKFFVPLVVHILIPIYFITHIRRELLKINIQNSPEVKELVKAAEENILLNSSVTVEQNRENNFANSSAPTEETLLPFDSPVAEEQKRRYNFANSSAPTEEAVPLFNGAVVKEQNRRYNFANSSAPPQETPLPFDSPVGEEQNRIYNFANSSAPPEETLLLFESHVTEEQNRRYNFTNSSAPTEESLISPDSTVTTEQKRIYNFANPSAPPEEIALYPVDELKGLTTEQTIKTNNEIQIPINKYKL